MALGGRESVAMGALILAGLCSRAAVAAPESVTVKADAVNLYLEPDTSSKVLATAARGTQLQVLESSGGWYRVTDPRSGYGVYARKADLEGTPPASPPPAPAGASAPAPAPAPAPLPAAAATAAPAPSATQQPVATAPTDPPAAPSLTIDHAAVGCIVAGKFPTFEARLEPAEQVSRARIDFRADDDTRWYYVDMEADDGVFRGTLPQPLDTTKTVHYYIEAVDRQLGEFRTAEISPIVARAGECDRKSLVAAPFVAKAIVNIGGTAAGVPVPPGFASTGIAGASATSSAATASASGSTGGGGLGTGTVAVGAGVAAIAAGIVVAVQTDAPLTGQWAGTLVQNEANGQCTGNWNLVMDLTENGDRVTGRLTMTGTGATVGLYLCSGFAGDTRNNFAMTDGRRDGDSVSLPFSFSDVAPDGTPYTIRWTFNGSLSGDRRGMSGTMTGGNQVSPTNDTGPWSASKR